MEPIRVIGGGLAGSEASWQIASLGLPVVLYEMRPDRCTEAHCTDGLAELVCSNSFRSDDARSSASGLIHDEMRYLNSIIMKCADSNKVPAGGALAVDRVDFSSSVTEAISSHPLITVRRMEISSVPPRDWGNVIVATGPLTSVAFSSVITDLVGGEKLSFFDATSPVVYYDTINEDRTWRQSRYDKIGPCKESNADYINCPMTKDQYYDFVHAILSGDKVVFKDWEKVAYFEGCLPIEVMVERGLETLRHGPMKAVGLTGKSDLGLRPYAVVQLRQDNFSGTLWNIVGFQTKLKYSEQRRIFRMIPGLEKAEFARFGRLHRNTYIDSPKLLDKTLRLKTDTRFRFAGQITGCEGYAESAAIGLLAGRFAAVEQLGRIPVTAAVPPRTTVLGGLLDYVTSGHIPVQNCKSGMSFKPMNANFGLLPSIDGSSVNGSETVVKKLRGVAKKLEFYKRSLAALEGWCVDERESHVR